MVDQQTFPSVFVVYAFNYQQLNQATQPNQPNTQKKKQDKKSNQPTEHTYSKTRKPTK